MTDKIMPLKRVYELGSPELKRKKASYDYIKFDATTEILGSQCSVRLFATELELKWVDGDQYIFHWVPVYDNTNNREIMKFGFAQTKLAKTWLKGGYVRHESAFYDSIRDKSWLIDVQDLVNMSLARYEMGQEFEKRVEIPVHRFKWEKDRSDLACRRGDDNCQIYCQIDDNGELKWKLADELIDWEFREHINQELAWNHKSVKRTRELIEECVKLSHGGEEIKIIRDQVKSDFYTVKDLVEVNKIVQSMIKIYKGKWWNCID